MKTLAGIYLLAGALVFGQAVSQISGTVKDDSGAVVPGVEITATQTETGARRTAMTDESGSYILPNLPLGPYRLEASKAGFRSYVQTGIELQVGGNPVIPVVLGVGQVSESIQVEASVTSVETRSAGVGTVIETQRILDLPLNGRQATDLIRPRRTDRGRSAVQHARGREHFGRWRYELQHPVQSGRGPAPGHL